MAGGIFISYRRDDTRHVAGRLAGDLADHFGAEAIFRDVESIEGGEEFPVKLERALGQCEMMLVLIGPDWLNITDPAGRRRLDQPDDWVRQEIAGALRRGIRVVPVLVEDAPLPAETDLPEDLRPLVRRQTRMLSDARWRGDLLTLVEMLAKVPGLSRRDGQATLPAPVAPAARSFRTAGLGALVLAVVAAAGFAWSQFTAVPDLSGTWRTDDKYNYLFTQDGREVEIQTRLGEQPYGKGNGQYRDGKLKLVFNTGEEGQRETENCELEAKTNFTVLEGDCRIVGVDAEGKPYEPYPYKMYR